MSDVRRHPIQLTLYLQNKRCVHTCATSNSRLAKAINVQTPFSNFISLKSPLLAIP